MSKPDVRLTRTWTVIWKRPQRLGWPSIVAKVLGPGYVSGMAPKLVRVTVTQLHDGEPEVTRLAARGRWLTSGRDSGWRDLSLTPVAGTGLWMPAPDWVHDLAGQSLQMIRREEQA
jgi:hypothetical protein